MSEHTIYIVFDAQSSHRLRHTQYLSEFVRSTAAYKFDFFSDFQMERVLGLELALEVAGRNRDQAILNHDVSDILHFTKSGLHISIGFDIINWNMFLITVSSRCFPYERNERVRRFRDLVQFCVIAYNNFSPEYGYGLTSPEYRTIEPSNLQAVPDTIFDLNFFGPKLVERIGKEKLAKCPTWRTAEFSDGGMLLELSDDPIERPQEYQGNYIKTADILGLTKT